MRALFLASLFAVTACATTPTKPASGPPAPTAFQPVCQPCPMPCTPETSCAGPKTPTFSPAPGSFQSAQQVTVTSDPGAVVRCTTDGSAPTAATPATSGAVSVDKNQTLKCIATRPGTMPSSVATGAYDIRPPAPPPPPPPPPVAAPAPPPPPPPLAKTGDKIDLKEKIQFDTGKATIKPVSYPVLDDVAKRLSDHPEVKKVAIEGYTDNVGKAAANKKLSQARAEAVRAYLVKKNVAADRLTVKGFGPDKPIADNKTAAGREQNRRVELKIAQ